MKMGADNNPNVISRLVTLQTRKQALEEKIAAKNNELRNLCIKEAELTGIMPAEIPLEAGEIIPVIRRRVGTAFEYPENVINTLNNEHESIPTLETQIEVQKKITQAALQLANNSTMNKSLKRKNMTLYRQYKQQLDYMEERLETLKSQGHLSQTLPKVQSQQLKQKKKPRPSAELDSISHKSNLSQNDELNVNQGSRVVDQNNITETDHSGTLSSKSSTYNKHPYLYEGDVHNANVQSNKIPEKTLVAALNRLTLNNYPIADNNRRSSEGISGPYIQASYPTLYSSNPSTYHHHHHQQQLVMPNTNKLVYIPHSTTVPASPSATGQYQTFPTSQQQHILHNSNPRVSCHVDTSPKKYQIENYRNRCSPNGGASSAYSQHSPHSQHSLLLHLSPQNYNKHVDYMDSNNYVNMINTQHNRESDTVFSGGLGGYWIKTENGDMVWCSTVAHHDANTNSAWHTDARFGSLDRRKGKHIHNKCSSPYLDQGLRHANMKPAVNSHQELTKQMTLQPSMESSRNIHHDKRQLFRTQSLGSVGAQTVDSVWPSDDNSSYDSDGYNMNEINSTSKKLKKKGWCETSLDSPVVQASSHSQPIIIAEEPQHQVPVTFHSSTSPPSTTTRTSKPILEIPAESHPSPAHVETNVELFNNNALTDLPKNCTIVQAGQCKPYREITKPFEMSDFYKYSTKFRERNQEKVVEEQDNNQDANFNSFHPAVASVSRTDNTTAQDDESDVQKGTYQPLLPMKCQPLSSSMTMNKTLSSIGSPCSENLNSTLDSSLILNTSNVAEHFSAEMNAWYQSHGQSCVDNNNTANTASLSRSNATLV